ncbi:MAG TPA: type II secretion system protein GspG, partial [Kiritimatiellia bacterium]|nr:type II secretion system protein GspG [Kiritimatiellia bacterium]
IFAMRHNGKLPDSLDELTVGTDDAPGLLKEGALNDSWGTPFTYTKTGKKFKIVSAGPDGEVGTDDDLTN